MDGWTRVALIVCAACAVVVGGLVIAGGDVLMGAFIVVSGAGIAWTAWGARRTD